MFDPLTMLAGLLPLGVEAGKALIQRYLVPDQVKPADFNQLLDLRRLDLQLWQGLQAGDAPSYPWVAAIRQLQRPVFVAGVLIAWAFNPESQTVTNMASSVGFYLFGDRTLFYAKGRA